MRNHILLVVFTQGDVALLGFNGHLVNAGIGPMKVNWVRESAQLIRDMQVDAGRDAVLWTVEITDEPLTKSAGAGIKVIENLYALISSPDADLCGAWSKEDSKLAATEGWDVFEVDAITGLNQIERCDEMEIFYSDAAAWLHVWERAARNPRGMHARAVAKIAATNPREYAEFMKFVSDSRETAKVAYEQYEHTVENAKK